MEETRACVKLNTELSPRCDQRFFHLPREHPSKDETHFPLRCLGCVSFFSIPIMTFPPSLHLSLSFPLAFLQILFLCPCPWFFFSNLSLNGQSFPSSSRSGLKDGNDIRSSPTAALTWDHEGSPKSPHPAVQYGRC